MKKLQKALKDQKKQTKQEVLQVVGSLGIPLGGQRRVEVASRNSFVYVRLRDNENEVIQAYNNKVSPTYNLPVIVERQGNKWVVVSVNTVRYQNNWNSYAPFLPRHGNTHSFNQGGDVTWVYPQQFMPLLVLPSGSDGGMSVVVSSFILQKADGTWLNILDQGTPSFSPYVPVSGAVMGLVYLDSNTGSASFIINSGSYFSSTVTGTSDIVPYLPTLSNPNYIPLAGVRLTTGTSTLLWSNLYDVRPFLHPRVTGSGGGEGISGIAAQNEGVPLGTGTTFNFVGNGVTASRSGTVVNVGIPFGAEYAVISSGYTGTVIPSGSTSNVKFYQELSNPSSLVSISADSKNLVFNTAGWYSVNLVLQCFIGGGSALAGNGKFVITGDNNGWFDNAYLDRYVKAGEAYNGHNEFMNYSLEMAVGEKIGIILQNNTEGSIDAYIQELRIEKK